MNFFSLIFLLTILKLTSSARNWFGLKKDDKAIKDDCEPKILTISKTKIIPVAVPVYQKNNVYSIDLMKNELETKNKKPSYEEIKDDVKENKDELKGNKDELEERSNNIEEKSYYLDYDFGEDVLKKHIYDDDEDLEYLYEENF